MSLCASCGESTTHPEICMTCGGAVLLVGRYRLLKAVGSGALGQVFMATDTTDDTRVAVKKLAVHRAASPKARALFDREAAVLRQLAHPQIPTYRDHFVEGRGFNRALYLVQEFVDGETLAEELEHRRYSEDDALEVMASLLAVLVYLHGLNPQVIHRDLKPGNIIRRGDGSLALIDFGSVRDAISDPELGGSTVAGTLGFMAPEQFRGDADARTDLYALGALAVALLSRQDPSALQGYDGVLRWSEAVSVSPGLAALLDDLLRPDPADRPDSAAEVLTRLAAVRAGELPAVRALPQQRQRNPLVMATAGGALVAAALGFAVALWLAAPAPMALTTAAVPTPAPPAPPALDPVAPPPAADFGATWPAQASPQVLISEDHLLAEFPRTGLDRIDWGEAATWEMTVQVNGAPQTITYTLDASNVEMPLEERILNGTPRIGGLSAGASAGIEVQQDHLRLTVEDPALASALREDFTPDASLTWRGERGESWTVDVDAARWQPPRDISLIEPPALPSVPADWAHTAASCTASLVLNRDNGVDQVRVVGCPGPLARAVVQAAQGWKLTGDLFGTTATTVMVDFPGDGTASIPQLGVGEELVQIMPVD